MEDQRLMSSFLPLLREFIPSAAEEIETDIHDFVSKQGLGALCFAPSPPLVVGVIKITRFLCGRDAYAIWIQVI